MMENELPFCLIKFSKKRKYLESFLQKGELFFNSTENLNILEETNKEQGDENEGAEWIENVCLSEVKCNHPTLGEFKFKPDPKTPWKLTQFNHNYLTCSFYIITTKNFENTDILKVNEKMLEFGEHAIIIKNPKIFMDNLIEALELEDVDYSARKVKYKNLKSDGRIEMNPFIKKLEHKYQNEFRIIIKNQSIPKPIKIKDIDKIGQIVSSKFIVESKWQLTGKKPAHNKA